ncbi:hypothetical protein [Rufibacter immobilis]|uniref:hypothetical protein n=1 Tax=Rufibacter immobilis TaxID=1348778 RepID=UPI0035EB0401
MLSTVVTHKPQEELTLLYEGLIANGREDLESEEAQAMKGGREGYYLTPTHGGTQLSIEADLSPAYFEEMSAMWDKALLKIKELAEAS